MRAVGRVAAGAGAVLLLVGGYGVLDIYDQVPGVLTRADAPRQAVPMAGRTTPPPAASAKPPAPARPQPVTAASVAPVPDPARLASVVRPLLADPGLAQQTALSVHDAATGKALLEVGADRALTPASTTKVLSTYAVARTMDLDATLDTRVVQGAAGSVVLVAGGDTVINPAAGDPQTVSGRAGMADLAAAVARRLKAGGVSTTRVDYDLRYAPGPAIPSTWNPINVELGYTTRVASLGLSTERAKTGRRPPTDPARSAVETFAKRLGEQGITATVGRTTQAPDGATQLGVIHSAPLVDVLGLYLQDSDDAMAEAIARQAAFRQGRPGDVASVTTWVQDVLRTDGIDLRGVRLADASGLADGTTIPTRVLIDVLQRGASGRDAGYARVLERMPVAGLSGTLSARFATRGAGAGIGVVRAKTGTLPAVTALAGTVRDADGRVLVFAILNNGAQPAGALEARAAVDRIVAALATCGCR